MHLRWKLLPLIVLLSLGQAVRAETDESLQEELARLEAQLARLDEQSRQEIEALKARIAELEKQLAEAEKEAEKEAGQGEIDELIAEAEKAAAGEVEKEQEAEQRRETMTGRQRSLQALNPEISFLGDVSYDWTDNRVPDRFLLRGAEIAFQSALDPYTRFKGYLAGHQEPAELEEPPAPGAPPPADAHGGEIGVNLEEAYMEWVALPAHSRLRVGLFRQQFGTLNRWHPHALPSADVPFALRDIFGHEGLVGLGVAMDWQLPGLWATSHSLSVEIVNADNDVAFAGSEFRDPTVLLRHTGFFDLGQATYFELGLTGLRGPNDRDGDLHTTVGSLDVNFVWEPPQRARYRGLEIRGEILRSSYELPGGDSLDATSGYLYASWKLGRRFLVGLRYDDAELPTPDAELLSGGPVREGLRERGFTPYLTFWQSEYVRLRFQYQHADRDFDWANGPADDDRMWLQATFAAGPHKHESY